MLDQIPLQLDRERIKEREDGERGVGGGGGGYFKILPSKGGEYLREAINREMAITLYLRKYGITIMMLNCVRQQEPTILISRLL